MRCGWPLFVVLLLCPGRAGAEEEATAPEEEPPPDTRKESSFGLGLGVYSFAPFVGNATFRGDGIPKAGGPRQNFVHTGRELGAVRPGILTMEVRLDYLSRHFEGGLHFFYGGHLGSGKHGTDPAATAIADGSSIYSAGGGLHAAAVFPFAQSFAFSAGADFGARVYWVNLPGYRDTTCHTKYGTRPCPETANTADIYFQPRFAFTWNSAGASKDSKSAFALGLWAGPDLAHGVSYAFGVTLGLAPAHGQLR